MSGDSSIATYLTGDSTTIPPTPIDPGNQQFFRNILGTGTHVLVESDYDLRPANSIDTYYNSLAGVHSSTVLSPTTVSLSGIDVYICILPPLAYSATDAAALRAFVDNGGTAVFLGDNAFFGGYNSAINQDAAAIGTNLRIVNASLDPGTHTASGAQIGANPLTNGVDTFSYAYTSTVSTSAGGVPLFFASGGQTFVAAEQISAAPEPASLAMWACSGLVGICIRARQKYRCQAASA